MSNAGATRLMTTTDHVPPSQGSVGPGGRPLAAGARPATGNRLPAPPRERKPALAALAVLLILGGALLSTTLVLRSDDTVAAIALSRDVAAGEKIPASALTRVRVPRDGGPQYVAYNDVNIASVVRAYAREKLVAGSLLHAKQTVGTSIDPGQVVVNLSLKPEQYPSEDLKAGDRVTAYLADTAAGAAADSGKALVRHARVYHVPSDKKKDSFDSGNNAVVSLAVDEADAPQLALAAAKDAVVLVLESASGN
jgi:hypothetical protein